MKRHRRMWSYWHFTGIPENRFLDSIWQIVPITGPPDRTTDVDTDDIHVKLVYIPAVQEGDGGIGHTCSYTSCCFDEDYWTPIRKEDIPFIMLARVP